MPNLRLTDITLAGATAITPSTLIHIVTTADTSQYSGGSSYASTLSQIYDGLSGYCISDFYVTNIHSCSPLNINPLDEGNVYFGSTSGVTIDVINSRFGVGTSSPQYPLHIIGLNSLLYYDPTLLGGIVYLSGNTGLPRYALSISPYLTKPATGGSYGIRTWDDALYPGYGKNGDMFLYAGNETNGLNIINQGPGTDTEDYIRFYAGQDADGNISDIHIQGSGTTRGYVGMGTETPSERLEVSGTTKTTNLSATTISGGTSTINGTKGTVTTDGSSTTAFINVSGSGTVGGTGYTDFIRVTNTAAGATNPNKTFRVNNTGNLEIVDSAYSNTIFTLTESGEVIILGKLKSAINYSQVGGGSSVTLGASASPQTILSTTITTSGNPVRISAYGDAENTGAGYWSKLQFWRDSTQLGAIVHTEGSNGSENSPFGMNYIDNPVAGTYTYYLKANQISGGNINFGESTAPILTVQEL